MEPLVILIDEFPESALNVSVRSKAALLKMLIIWPFAPIVSSNVILLTVQLFLVIELLFVPFVKTKSVVSRLAGVERVMRSSSSQLA